MRADPSAVPGPRPDGRHDVTSYCSVRIGIHAIDPPVSFVLTEPRIPAQCRKEGGCRPDLHLVAPTAVMVSTLAMPMPPATVSESPILYLSLTQPPPFTTPTEPMAALPNGTFNVVAVRLASVVATGMPGKVVVMMLRNLLVAVVAYRSDKEKPANQPVLQEKEWLSGQVPSGYPTGAALEGGRRYHFFCTRLPDFFSICPCAAGRSL